MQKQNLIEALLIFSKSDCEIFMNSLFSAIRKDGIDTFAEKTGIAIQDIMNCDDPDDNVRKIAHILKEGS